MAVASEAVASERLGSTITRNAAFTVAGRLFFLVAWAAVTPYMLGVLGEERFGIWALFFALTGYFVTFDLGLSQTLTRYVAQFTAQRDDRSLRGVITIGAVAYLALTAPLVVSLAIWQDPILDFIRTPAAFRREAGWALVGMALVLGAQNLTGVMTAVLAGRQRMDVTNGIHLATTSIQIAGSMLALALGHGLRGLVVALGVGVAASAFLSWRAIRAIAPEVRLEFSAMSGALVRELSHFSAALQIVNLGSYFQFQLDKFLLAYFGSLAVVARFELAMRISLAAWAIPLLLLPPLVPAVSHLVSHDDFDRVARLYRRASRYLLAISFPLALFTIALAPHIGMAWLGPGFPEVAWVTVGMLAYLLVMMGTGVGTAVARGVGEPWIEARAHLLGLAAHLAASLALIPRWGLAGAVVALVVAAVVSAVYFVWRFHARMGMSTWAWIGESVARPAVVSLVAAGASILLTRSWFEAPVSRGPSALAVGVGIAVFGVAVAIAYPTIGVVTREELRGVGHWVARRRGLQ